MVLLVLIAGCASRRPATSLPSTRPIGLAYPTYVDAVDAACVPPSGWVMQPLKRGSNFAHQTWVSPGGDTAYGVIRFALPLPVGPETVLFFFLREMRASEGGARLLSKQRDERLKGLRFVAEGGKYITRTNLTTGGFRGWAVYAGTLRDRPILHNELSAAELARENTETGVDANRSSARP
jgi:hypothetical protein